LRVATGWTTSSRWWTLRHNDVMKETCDFFSILLEKQ
jgi:hypothetical protein